MGPTTEVVVGKLRFKNPVLLASGPLSSNEQNILRACRRGFGGVVTKTVTLTPCEGNPRPRWAFQDCCLVSADGLPNPGYGKMAEIIRRVKDEGFDVPLIASVAGSTPGEYADMAAHLERAGADAIELNLVCPHKGRLVGGPEEEPLGDYWSRTPEQIVSVIRSVKEKVGIPVWAKFPSVRPADVVSAAQEAGADAIVPFPGVIPGMVIDVEAGKPVLGNVEGSGTITGQAIRPLGIKVVSELSRKTDVPIIGTGGVATGRDVVEYLMAGAYAVQVLTHVMRKPTIDDILSELEEFTKKKGFEGVAEMRGLALRYLPPRR